MSPAHALKPRLDRIRPALAALRAFDPVLEVFGADTHHYDLAPPLPEETIAAFERDHRIVLPTEYRAFLAHVVASGAGPYYGLSKLHPRHDAYEPPSPWSDELADADADGDPAADSAPPEARPRPPDPARPFVLQGLYPPRSDVSLPQHHEPLPAGADPLDGTLHLSEHGCCYLSFLVLNGAHVGEVWDDYRAGGGSIGPTRLGFLAWYERWLAEAVADAAYNAALEAVLELEPAVDLRVVEQLPSFDETSARHPTWAHGHTRRGFVLVHARRFAEAEAAFARALELNAALAHAQLGLAANKAARGDYEGALALLDRWEDATYLTRIHVLSLRASVLRAARDARGARAAEEAILTRAGKRPFYPIEHAFRLARARDLDGSYETLRAAEERLREDGLGGMDEWLRRLAARCRVKGRADLAEHFEAAAADAEPGTRGADRRGWPTGPIRRHFFP
ncbi:MAG: hypothetical protein QM820_06880 [Minicystis sp.]